MKKGNGRNNGPDGPDEAADSPSVDDEAGQAAADATGEQAPQTEAGDATAGESASGGEGAVAPTPDDNAEKLKDRLLRLQADFENYRKRTLRDKADLSRRANEDLVNELLPALDHLELALAAAEQHDADKVMVEGFRLVSEQLLAALAKFGVTPVDAQGAVFDPNVHEAVSHIPSADVPENVVIVQTRRGYMLGDRLLRAAQVVVSSGAPAEA